MKAKEYFEKYEEAIIQTGVEATKDLFNDMFKEASMIIENRNVKTDEGAIAVLKEMNQKWNAIATQFERKYGDSPLVWNGFKNLVKEINPVLAKVL